jgi:hypothetical protein
MIFWMIRTSSAVWECPPNFRERTIGLIALILNVIPMQIFNKRNWQEAMRGIVFPTLAYVILWMYLYGYDLLKY